MAGWMEGYVDAIHGDRLAELRGLGFGREIFAVTQAHDVERLCCRQHLGVTGTGVVGMAVGDQRALHRAGRVDVEAAGLGPKAGWRRAQEIFGAHAGEHKGAGGEKRERGVCHLGRAGKRL